MDKDDQLAMNLPSKKEEVVEKRRMDLTIEIDTEHFIFFDNKLKIVVDASSEIKVEPSGIYKGFNWFKPLSLGTFEEIFDSKIKEMESEEV